MDVGDKLSRSFEISERITGVLQKRVQNATERFQKRAREALSGLPVTSAAPATDLASALSGWQQYIVDCTQRAVIFWDTLRQRGNNYLEHVQQGQPPVLRFKYEMVLDGRTLERPVN